MINAVIFDLDGTLWDPTGCAVVLWNNVLKKHQIPLEMTRDKVKQLMGKTMEEIGLTLFPALPAEFRSHIVDEYGNDEVDYLNEHGAVLFDGLEDTLKELKKKYRLFIVSNSQDGYVPAFLHAHQLGGYFEDIEMSGRTGLDKGGNIRLIIERNQIQNAVYVGDTESDEKASRIAGIPFIHAAYGFGRAFSPDAVISEITDLPRCLAEMSD